jgi:radical SAM protein with 4Fe4S-binding SPASM domain
MRFEEFVRIFRQFPYCHAVSFNGFGEPYLNRDLFRMLHLVHRARPHVNTVLFSHGGLLDEARARSTIVAKLKFLHVSLDAGSAESYARIRKRGDFDTVVQNVARLVQLKRELGSPYPLVGVAYTFMPENCEDPADAAKFVRLAREMGVDFISNFSLLETSWGHTGKLGDKLNASRSLALAALEEVGLDVYDMSGLTGETADSCRFLWGQPVQVNYRGDLVFCCWYPLSEQFSYGNLLESSFRELWNGEQFTRFRERARRRAYPHPFCRDCSLVPF